MPELREPIPAEQAAGLRRLVLELRAADGRRRFAPELHVGHPAGVRVAYGVRGDESLDSVLRVEVVAALLLRVRHQGGQSGPSSAASAPLVWLTRPGDLDQHDVDVDWLAAARAAYAEAGAPLTMVVVTRTGWVDPRTGTRRRWLRLRQR